MRNDIAARRHGPIRNDPRFLSAIRLIAAKAIAAAAMAWGLGGCSTEPEPDGECALSCNGAKFAGSEFTIKHIFPPGDSEFTCIQEPLGTRSNELIATAPVRVRFRVEKHVVTSPSVPDLSKKNKEEEDKGTFSLMAIDKVIPVSGVSFTPQVIGSVAGSMTNTENATITQTQVTSGNVQGTIYNVDPVQFAGVVTPQSEWCSDACGIATIEIWPLCFDNSNITVSLSSGSVYSDPGFSWGYTMDSEEEGDTADTAGFKLRKFKAKVWKTSPTAQRDAALRKIVPGFFQRASLDRDPLDAFGFKPWVEHAALDVSGHRDLGHRLYQQPF